VSCALILHPNRGWRGRPAPKRCYTVVLWLALVAAGSGVPHTAGAEELAIERIRGNEESIASSLPEHGDPGGVRKWLSEKGVNYGVMYKADVLGNLTGGIRRGVIYEDKVDTYIAIDFEKLIDWKGLTFYSNQFWIHGTGGIGRSLVGGLNTISHIEALQANRLSELWIEQKFWDDKASIRIGQLTADDQFYVARYADLFINTDWPAIAKFDLPSGGPAYPLSTPGVRFAFEPVKDVHLLVALFNGDPAGPGPEHPEIKNRHGLNFRLSDPPLLISEAQYGYNLDKQATGLARILRLGAWHHFGSFNDQRFDAFGFSLADPSSNGIAARRRGNDGIYGIIDQQLWRPQGGDANSGITAFTRVSASPSDRNLIDLYVDGGITFAGLLPARPKDKFGASVIYSRISNGVAELDRDRILFTGLPQPVHDYELSVDFTYQAQIVPGWTIQPDFQYIMHPGGHAPNPFAPLVPIKNAVVIGVRTSIEY
jgi:porin